MVFGGLEAEILSSTPLRYDTFSGVSNSTPSL